MAEEPKAEPPKPTPEPTPEPMPWGGLPNLREHLEHPNEVLAKKLAGDWIWASSLVTSYRDEGSSRLRKFVRGSRELVWETMERAKSARTSAEEALSGATEPSETAQHYKTAFFNFRRRYPQAIVGFAAAVSVLPAVLLKGTPRLERARVLVRNVIIGGGTTSVLLYPEFVTSRANYVEKVAGPAWDKIEKRVGVSRE